MNFTNPEYLAVLVFTVVSCAGLRPRLVDLSETYLSETAWSARKKRKDVARTFLSLETENGDQ